MPQSLSKILVHIIFSTKNRKSLLKNLNTRRKLHEYLTLLCEKLGSPTICVGGVDDHVHLLLCLNKNYSLSSLIEIIKKDSSKHIKRFADEDAMLKYFYWQSGYGAFSVSKSNIDKVKAYILNQEDHHKKFNFQEELRKILESCGVEYDEKYVWG